MCSINHSWAGQYIDPMPGVVLYLGEDTHETGGETERGSFHLMGKTEMTGGVHDASLFLPPLPPVLSFPAVLFTFHPSLF